jgi:hypothetical protein
MQLVGGGVGGLFGGGVGDSLCSGGASAELRNVLLLLADAPPKYSSHTEPFLIVFFRDVGALVCFAGTCARGKESRKIIRVLRILLTPPLLIISRFLGRGIHRMHNYIIAKCKKTNMQLCKRVVYGNSSRRQMTKCKKTA